MDFHLPTEAKQYLEKEFKLRKTRRPHYSLRAYARDLGLSASSLSEVMAGKQGLSEGTAVTLARKIQLSAQDTEHFLDLVSLRSARNKESQVVAAAKVKARLGAHKSQLALDRFELISQWQHFAILELVDLGSSYQSVDALSKALGLSKIKIQRALERLQRVGLLDIENWKTLTPKTHVGEEVPSRAIKEFHSDVLEMAKEALMGDPVSEREFQSVVFSIRQEDLAELKKDIEKSWRDLLSKYIHKDRKDRLMFLGVQLFPAKARQMKKRKK